MWDQNDNPFGRAPLTIVRTVPVVALASGRVKAHVAANVAVRACDASNATQHDHAIIASSEPATVANRIC
jgi:hypothetical protein